MAVRASKKPVGSAQTFSTLIIHIANSAQYKLTKTLLCYNQSLFTTRLQWLDILDCLRSRIKLIKIYICNRLKFLLLYLRFCFYFILSFGWNWFILISSMGQSICDLDCKIVILIFWLSKYLKCHSVIYRGKCAANRL